MTEPGNENQRPAGPEWSAAPKPPMPPTVAPWPGPDGPAAPAARSGGLSRTGWVVVGGGLGCLMLIILGMALWMFTFFVARHSEVNSGRAGHGFSFRQMVPPGLAPEAGRSPYASHVRDWQHICSGAPANGNLEAFDKQLDNWVFTANGERLQKELGEVTNFTSETEFGKEGTNGVSVVTLSGASKKTVKLYVSFEQAVGGEWEFKLDMYR